MLKFMTSMSKGDFEVNINQNSTIIILWQLYCSLCKILTARLSSEYKVTVVPLLHYGNCSSFKILIKSSAFTIDYEYYLTLGRIGRRGGGGVRGCMPRFQ